MRKRINLNQDWTFYKEGKAEKVSLPHTWNALDGQDGGGDYYRGCCRYVKYMSCPPLEEGEEAYLEFLGASASAEVKVNGHCVGSHDGGYSAFRFRITDCLMDENIIEVFVDNSANDRVYPQKEILHFMGASTGI